MKSIIIYHHYIPKVGGIESAVYNLTKGLYEKGYKVTIAYYSAESVYSLFNYARVSDIVKLEPDIELKADICLLASNHAKPKQIKAKRFLQWIHSDYDKYKLDLKNVGEVEYIAVSKHCSKVIEKREGVKSKVIYNLLDEDFGKRYKFLKLVTNSRVSPEKGFGRMLQLATLLKNKGVTFRWVVYGDNTFRPNEYQDWINKFKHIEEVQFVGFKKDITIGLQDADYLVQLSDWEGCPLAVLEALKMEIPCIVTNWGGIDELIQDRKNGYILPMDMKIDNIIDNIINNIPKFKYEPKSTIDEWVKLIETKDVQTS